MRKYRIPETRLPFVNTEIAEVKVAGQLRLVSSVCGGQDGGRIYLFDPDTGQCFWRPLPEGISCAYMLRTGPDGLLYIGCSEGSLAVYDPDSDRFEVLVRGEMSGITWGGCVTDSLVVWSASPGEACVYDWRQRRLVKVFRPLDSERPAALYAHNVLECPDGKVMLGLNVPQARLVLLDPATLEAKSHTPGVLENHSYTQWLSFPDADRLAIVCSNELFILRYPSFELVRRIARPPGAAAGHHVQRRACCLIGGEIFGLFWPGGDLMRVDPANGDWQAVKEGFTGDSPAVLHALADRYVCALTSSGRFLRYDARTGEVFERELDSTGPMDTHALCVVPQIHRAFGAPYINQRFWDIDLNNGNSRDLGRAAPGGGQICCMEWDEPTARLLMASYTTCTVTAFDPDTTPAWPANPRVLARAGHEQMRPRESAHDGRFVWLASSPEYGLLGGALSRLDPRTGEIRVWRNLVPNQKPNSLVLNADARRIYLATEIYADGESTAATERTAQLVSFNIDSLTIDQRQSVREGADILRLLALLPSGKVLGLDGKTGFTWRLTGGMLFVWDPDDGTVEPLEEIDGPLNDVAVAGDGDGKVYASLGDRVGTLALDGGRVSFDPIAQTPDAPGRFLQIRDGTLYCIAHNELWAMPLE